MQVIEHIEVGAGGIAEIEFTSIPTDGTYTDLLLKVSARVADAGSASNDYRIYFNGSATSLSGRILEGLGSGSGVSYSVSFGYAGSVNTSISTSDTFTSLEIYIPNFASSNNKSFSVDSVAENNATGAKQQIIAGLWSSTSAINQINLYRPSVNTVQYSSATLFGITAGSDGSTTVS